MTEERRYYTGTLAQFLARQQEAEKSWAEFTERILKECPQDEKQKPAEEKGRTS